MLLIQWFQVDWIKIQWIMFGIFIALIALIRIVRRLTRWGSLKNNQVSCETNTFGGLNYEKYSRQNHSTNTLPNTCVITPLSKRGKKNYFLGVSLAQLGTKVFVFDSENALALLNMSKTSVKNIREFAKQHKIGTFVVFDWATAPLIDFLSRANEGFEDT